MIIIIHLVVKLELGLVQNDELILLVVQIMQLVHQKYVYIYDFDKHEINLACLILLVILLQIVLLIQDGVELQLVELQFIVMILALLLVMLVVLQMLVLHLVCHLMDE